MKNWFEVDKQGLANILERRGKEPMSYEEIDAEWERLAAETSKPSRPLPRECKAGVTAFMQHAAGLVIRARCPHCGGLLEATVLNLGDQGRAPFVRCPCGRSKNFSRAS